MTDQEILDHTRLSADELKAFFKKFNDFFNSLSTGERQFISCSLKSPHTAAAEFGVADVSAERLEKALRSQVPEGILCFCCTLSVPEPPPPPEPTNPPK